MHRKKENNNITAKYGEHYYLCSYKFYFNPDISNPDNVEYYAEIIKAEVAASKARKKHNTAYYE